MENNVVKDSFIALSDFHCYEWPINMIKNFYLNKHDKIFILGNSTSYGEKHDGTNGLSVLLKIKELADTYPGRVVYIPGGHDFLLYNYITNPSYYSMTRLVDNGGAAVLDDVNDLKETNKEQLNELTEWLGSLPLQVVHRFDGQDFGFAHSFFNQKLYDSNHKFNLKDLQTIVERKGTISGFDPMGSLFYEKGCEYPKECVPNSDIIEVLGQGASEQSSSYELENIKGDKVKVKCIDGGLANGGDLFVYSGYGEPTLAISSVTQEEFKYETEDLCDEFFKAKSMLDEKIIERMKASYNAEDCYLSILNGVTNGSLFENDELDDTDYNKLIPLILGLYKNQIHGNTELVETEDMVRDYVDKVSTDFIIKQSKDVFITNDNILYQLFYFLATDMPTYIPEINGARNVAKKIGTDTVKRVVSENHFTQISEYVKSVCGNTKAVQKIKI